MKYHLKSGDKFGNWTCIQFLREAYWLCRCSCGLERPVYIYSFIKGKSRACHSCGGKMGHPARNVLKRFKEKIIIDPVTGCWNFNSPPTKSGCGRFKLGNKTRDAYKVAHELFKGPVPKGKELHHVCENRMCVRQHHKHVTPVSRREHLVNLSPTNIAYKNAHKTHCPKGHPLIMANLVRWALKKKRQRICRKCHTEVNIRCARERARRQATEQREPPSVTSGPQVASLAPVQAAVP